MPVVVVAFSGCGVYSVWKSEPELELFTPALINFSLFYSLLGVAVKGCAVFDKAVAALQQVQEAKKQEIAPVEQFAYAQFQLHWNASAFDKKVDVKEQLRLLIGFSCMFICGLYFTQQLIEFKRDKVNAENLRLAIRDWLTVSLGSPKDCDGEFSALKFSHDCLLPSQQDEAVPIEQGRQLVEVLRADKKTYHSIYLIGHTSASGAPNMAAEVNTFIGKARALRYLRAVAGIEPFQSTSRSPSQVRFCIGSELSYEDRFQQILQNVDNATVLKRLTRRVELGIRPVFDQQTNCLNGTSDVETVCKKIHDRIPAFQCPVR
jgi:hypothetical protein